MGYGGIDLKITKMIFLYLKLIQFPLESYAKFQNNISEKLVKILLKYKEMKVCLKSIYYQACFEELRVLKPGNHSINSKILGMDHKKFELGAKISSEILSNENLSLGESIYKSATECFKILRANYNLGIILLCAPIFKIKNMHNFRYELNQIINSISENQGKLISDSIKEVSPAGIKKYSGNGDVNLEKTLVLEEL